MFKAVLVTLVIAGCVPLPSKNTIKSGAVWAQPGSTPAFRSSLREHTSRYYAYDGRDPHWNKHEPAEIDRTWFSMVDPVTGTTTQLAAVRAPVTPFYWDGSVLWVKDMRGSIVGLGATETVHAPGMIGELTARDGLPPPFAIVRRPRTTIIFNAATHGSVELPGTAALGVPYVDGSILRLARTSIADGVLKVEETVIDWSTAQRLADIEWSSPQLQPSQGQREAYTLLPDGRRVAEVVTIGERTQLYVRDVISGGPPTILAVERHDHAELYAVGGDHLVYAAPDKPCWRGSTIAITRRAVTPIPDATCVQAIAGDSGRYWLALHGTSGYVDADATIVDLGYQLESPLVIDASTVAFAHPTESGVTVDKLDLATGTLAHLATHASRADTLFNVAGGKVMFLGPMNTIVVEPSDGGATTTVSLPSLVEHGPDGESLAYEVAGVGALPERTKLWAGFGVGATSTGKLAFESPFEVRRFVTPTWAMTGGLLMRAEQDSARYRVDIGGNLGVQRFAKHHLRGWFAGGDVGLSRSTVREDNQIVETQVAPSASVRVGHQGRLVGLDLKAVAPSLSDPDRGVMVLGGMSFGAYGFDR
ncbi:MAG TPA: hypothetical protein VGO00_09255 [Kofleriaceae bacterium]|nr:hypothetical protein [Kofleriaceae bacterium]